MQPGSIAGAWQIITVSGAHKGVGKTALSELLLRNLRNFAAVKITITDDCYLVTDDDRDILAPSTDTWRMRQSGALKVVWVRTTEDMLQRGLTAALEKMVPCDGILIEGNSILRHLTPDIAFFVARPPFEAMKPSRINALQKADVCVINLLNGLSADEQLRQRIRAFNPGALLLAVNLLDPAAADSSDDYNRLLTLLRNRLA